VCSPLKHIPMTYTRLMAGYLLYLGDEKWQQQWTVTGSPNGQGSSSSSGGNGLLTSPSSDSAGNNAIENSASPSVVNLLYVELHANCSEDQDLGEKMMMGNLRSPSSSPSQGNHGSHAAGGSANLVLYESAACRVPVGVIKLRESTPKPSICEMVRNSELT
jgi:hypothetical protein